MRRRSSCLLFLGLFVGCSSGGEGGAPPATGGVAASGGSGGAGRTTGGGGVPTGGSVLSTGGGGVGGGSTGGAPGGSTGGGGGTGGAADAASGGGDDAGAGAADSGATGGGGSGDTGAGGEGPLPPAVRKVVILHDVNAGGSAGNPSRKSMVDILMSMKESHGIVVEMMDSPTKADVLMDKALIIVGPNASMFGDNHPDPGLKTLPVPIIVSKDGNTTEIGLGKVSATDPPDFNTITLINADHPLAAGLALGKLTVLTTPNKQRIITFAGVGPDAIKIAVGPQNTTSWAIVGYEKGGDMGGGVKAPAKRVGFFWHRPAAATPEGTKLFRAAVDWSLRP